MRKAKIALSAIAIFAVVGGAFAFKANRASKPFYKTDIHGACVLTTFTTYTTDPNLAIGPATLISTINLTSHAGPCTNTFLYPAL